MEDEKRLNCVISGSFFKFKPEIDLMIDHFTDLGVTVLAPDKGWLYIPPARLHRLEDRQFRPLPKERGMSIREIEDSFLEALSRSDFVYVVNPEGYVGDTVCFEMGFAMASGIPIYSQEQIPETLDPDPLWKLRIEAIEVLTPEEAVLRTKQALESDSHS